MPYIPSDTLAEIKQIDLFSYLKTYAVRGKVILQPHGKEFFTWYSKHLFTLHGKHFFT